MNDSDAEPQHPTQARIHLGAFVHNLGCVRSYCGPNVRIMAVVKANAYGHGVVECSRAARAAGASCFGVARVGEALEIRGAGIGGPVLVFEVAPTLQIPRAIEQDIDLTISSVSDAREISAAASRQGRNVAVHVKVDTGMGRLGFPASGHAKDIISALRLPRLTLAGVYSHFATAEDEDPAYARAQLSRFLGIVEVLRHEGIEVPIRHIANSGAIISLPESHLEMVRPGIMLYGYPPALGMKQTFPLRPVMSVVSSVSFVKTVDPGASISYGRTYVARTRTTIATIPIGYGDGYPRSLSGRGSVLIRGRRCPVAGMVCMDHIMIDAGQKGDCSPGDEVTIIGEDGTQTITAWDIAREQGTIPYEVTCAISARVPRLFTSKAADQEVSETARQA
jgi:alanine racemase